MSSNYDYSKNVYGFISNDCKCSDISKFPDKKTFDRWIVDTQLENISSKIKNGLCETYLSGKGNCIISILGFLPSVVETVKNQLIEKGYQVENLGVSDIKIIVYGT